ncbi:MAG TPA: peroxide stress protein YaaA [Bacteroidales bacterium]|nr:peroxide stress protein YaaA [Bacteroidales bacterium]
MLTIISPAKTLDFDVREISGATLPDYIDEATAIAGELKGYSPTELGRLMDISPKLAELNANRYAEWSKKAHTEKAKAAMLVYKGDVYQGLKANDFGDQELAFAQQHLRIISGLYGVLRPLDLILPYRLDMGASLAPGKAGNLYKYWTEKVTAHLAKAMKDAKSNILINLASEEYFKAVDTAKLGAEVITPVFKDYKNGQYKIISFFAKKARGMMSRFIISEKIEDPQGLKLFKDEGYFYNDNLSEGNTWVFTRG